MDLWYYKVGVNIGNVEAEPSSHSLSYPAVHINLRPPVRSFLNKDVTSKCHINVTLAKCHIM